MKLLARVKEISASMKITLKVGQDYISAEHGEVWELDPRDEELEQRSLIWDTVIDKVTSIQEATNNSRKK